jgi:hypothetical protein
MRTGVITSFELKTMALKAANLNYGLLHCLANAAVGQRCAMHQPTRVILIEGGAPFGAIFIEDES